MHAVTVARPLAGWTLSAAGDGTAQAYAARLLEELGARVVTDRDAPDVRGALAPGERGGAQTASDHEMWAASGAMALTGEEDGAPRSPGWPVASAMAGAASVLELLTGFLGECVRVDGPALLGERAAHSGLGRRGAVSPGGSCRLVRCSDGWVAVNMARPDDEAMVPAWLGCPVEGDTGAVLARAVAGREAHALEERAAMLGLPVARLGSPEDVARDDQGRARGQPWPVAPLRFEGGGTGGGPARPARPLVVDLSSLWAGPLCANLLGAAGARVVKVESTDRPDGARRGPPSFFDLLHAGHDSVALPFDTDDGRRVLRALLGRADVVIESSRPRAMEQLGIDPRELAATGVTWVSITAFGRTGPWSNRVGFGDDVAVAAGLVAGPADAPLFCGDAVADPIAGLHAAVGAVASRLGGGGHVVDVSMREAVASALAPGRSPELVARRDREGWVLDVAGRPVPVAPPRSRPASGRARPLGSDTDRVVRELTGTDPWR